MASKGTNARLYFDEWNFSGDTSQFVVNLTTGEAECTNLESTGAEYAPLLPVMSIEQSGYISTVGVNGTLERELYNRLATKAGIVACLLGTDDTNCPAYVQDVNGTQQMTLSTPTAGLMTLQGTWAKGKGFRGLRVYAGTATATGVAGAVCDLGAAGTDGGAAFLFVQGIDGTASNAEIKLQHATSAGGTYADLATWTVSAVGASKQTYAGSVRRYVRVNVTDLGGATGLTILVIACSQGVTQ